MIARPHCRHALAVAGLITALFVIFASIAATSLAATGSMPVPPNTGDAGVSLLSPDQQTIEFDCTTVTEIPQQECEALVALYGDTDGENWNRDDNWLITSTPCSWHGITCDGSNVDTIKLNDNHLAGTLPPQMGNLGNLEVLHLHDNQLVGSLPPEWGGLSQLYNLHLERNELTGPLPPEWGNMNGLKVLQLFGNQLDGALPSEMGDMTALEILALYENQFTGSIPASFGNLRNLKAIDLRYNLLEGPIPSELGALDRLDTLKLNNNLLTGEIPSALGNIDALRTLLLDYNLLSGEIPPELSNLPLLYTLTLNNNRLSGPIPPEFGNMPDIFRMNLGYNHLSGQIPKEFGMLATLRELRLNATGLSGPLPLELTDLNLTVFWFDNTYICIPNDPVILEWLETIPDLKTTGVTCPSIYVQKSASRLTAVAGDTIRYSISIISTTSTSVHFIESLPNEATYVSLTGPSGAVYDGATHEIRYDDPELAPGDVIEIAYEVKVNEDVESGALLIAMTTVSDDQGYTLQNPLIVVVPHITPVKTLVLIYAVGDNNLGTDMIRLLNRVEEGLANGLPESVKVEFLLDGPHELDTYIYSLQPDMDPVCPTYSNPDCSGRYVEGQDIKHLLTDSMTTPEELSSFMTQAINKYPNAEQIIVSLVGHGSGWEPNIIPPQPGQWSDKAGGLLFDTNPYTATLSTRELGDAFQWTQNKTARNIDLLYLDACSMGMIEVGYEVHSTVDFLLASESLSWTAFPYRRHIAAIDNSKDARAIGLAWLQNEAEYISSESNLPFTFSLTDLTQIEGLNAAINELGLELAGELPAAKHKLQQVHAETDCFESNYDGFIDGRDNYCDIKSLAEQVKMEFSANPTVTVAAGKVLSQIETVVISETHQGGAPGEGGNAETWTWGNIGGLSIYTPFNAEVDEWKRQHYTSTHLLFAQDSTWDQLVTKFWEEVEPPMDRDCTANCIAQPLPLPPKKIFLPATLKE